MVFSKDSWKEIFDTIKKNKLRTFLSGFTVALGILIFIILFGLGNGLQSSFSMFFTDDQVNTIRIYPSTTTIPYRGYESNRQIKFTNEDVKKIKENFKKKIEDIVIRNSYYTMFSYKQQANTYRVRAVSPGHKSAEKTIIMKGRYLHEGDILNKTKHVVIGRLVEEDLFKKENGLGKYIHEGGKSWKVVGVFQDEGGDREERNLYVPYTTEQKLRNNDEVEQMIVIYDKDMSYDQSLVLERELDAYIKNLKIISPKDNRGIYLSNTGEEQENSRQFASVLQIIISFIGIGTLLAGVIGISNIMVFVVKERTKEIGIRKAIGATPASIIAMILQESIFITMISGYFGLVSAILILNSIGDSLMEKYFISSPYIETSNAIWATIILIFFGALAGYLPARKAAKIKPIVALQDI
ncbi:MAG: ABC transporter ATP-binding protein [Flavobacteriales bacterium]|nr:ABC transporter ATP-binding protein [Flavobacteriales bacterium]